MRALAFDMTRLLVAATRATPRGIERVDADYASLLGEAWPGEMFGILPTPVGTRLFARETVTGLAAAAQRRWTATDVGEDALWNRLRARLLTGDGPTYLRAAPRTSSRTLSVRRGLAALRAHARPLLGHDAGRVLPHGAVHLDTGHIGLATSWRRGLPRRRPDIRLVALVHDLLSLDMPEYFVPHNRAYFSRLMLTLEEHAAGLLATSSVVCDRLDAHFRAASRPTPPILRMRPASPIPPQDANRADPDLAAVPFFVMIGTIEPRKNHLMILQAWRAMAEAGGPVPKLVLVGSRGWENELVVDMLERCEAIAPHVTEVSGLGETAVWRLLAHARGLLMPSFGEGYGLPIIETEAIGTPVFCADIPVFREVADASATFLHPLDGLGWMRAIRASADRAPLARSAVARRHSKMSSDELVAFLACV